MSNGIIEPYREVSGAIIVGTCGRLLLQQRDDVPGILYPGQIGLFGGHREGSETPLACIQRELLEELGLNLEPDRCTPLVELSLAYPLGGGIKASYYIVEEVPLDAIIVTEGAPLVIERSRLGGLLARMTPTACYGARLFLEGCDKP
jgi:8-oxo-dGTP diphosphatase